MRLFCFGSLKFEIAAELETLLKTEDAQLDDSFDSFSSLLIITALSLENKTSSRLFNSRSLMSNASKSRLSLRLCLSSSSSSETFMITATAGFGSALVVLDFNFVTGFLMATALIDPDDFFF